MLRVPGIERFHPPVLDGGLARRAPDGQADRFRRAAVFRGSRAGTRRPRRGGRAARVFLSILKNIFVYIHKSRLGAS